MAPGEDDNDHFYYGTPLEREEDLSRKKSKLAVEKGQARRVAPWQQEVVDAEGKRRFHGAFTGGFSAGYYNTVGSKEGWAPASFTSSRNQRAGKKEQQVYDFLDEDEKAELKLKELGTSAEYDSLGSTANELARLTAHKEAESRPSGIPGAIADEIVIPSTQSIGVDLLVKMGWRQGRDLGPDHMALSSDVLRRGRKAILAMASSGQVEMSRNNNSDTNPLQPLQGISDGLDNESNSVPDGGKKETIKILERIPEFVLHPQSDACGLGFEAKRLKSGVSKTAHLNRPKQGVTERTNFGVDDLDEFAHENEYDFVLDDEVEVFPETRTRMPLQDVGGNRETFMRRFHPAIHSSIQVRPQRFAPPSIPSDFTGKHVPTSRDEVQQHMSKPEAPQVPRPDSEIANVIEGIAAFVARSGHRFEDMLKHKHSEDPQFSFLFGGYGHDFYQRKLWEEQKVLSDQGKEPMFPRSALDKEAEFVGAERSKLSSYSGETNFASILASNSGPLNARLSDAASLPEGLSEMTTRFTTGGSDIVKVQLNDLGGGLKHLTVPEDLHKYPTRKESSWRPTTLLSKRFNLDPIIGMTPLVTNLKSGIESSSTIANLLGISAEPLHSNFSPALTSSRDRLAIVNIQSPELPKEEIKGVDIVPEDSIDLYKAIFSDDEDDYEDNRSKSTLLGDGNVDNELLVHKQSNAAQAVLNRLAADDLLESLGKELFLRVPT